MKSFVVLAASRFQDKACADLSAQFEFTKRHHELWVPNEILGMWVGPGPDIVSARSRESESSSCLSPRVALNIQTTIGVDGLWMMFCLEDPSLTRIRLLDKLVASGAQPSGDREPRFIPVFLRSIPNEARRFELSQLFARHPDEMCPPLLMNPMTGALSPTEVSPCAP